MKKSIAVGCLLITAGAGTAQESLPLLKDGKAPQTFEELWAGYDPRADPLETEILKEWEQDGVECRVLRYRIGAFKGVTSRMLALYGFLKGGTKLPGLVQIHGGGQSANLNAVLTNAKRGYACISVNWLCNDALGVSGYTGPNTDWGAVDATQHTHNDHFASLAPDAKTIDAVTSPRNNNWFLGTIAVRRALTFLVRQPEVDGTKLGVYGHSMGGVLTVMAAGSDARVKAAAPSCGGVGDARSLDTLDSRTLWAGAYLTRIKCPVIFLTPANDFNGPIQNLPGTADLLQSVDFRFTCVPHLNHRDKPEHYAAGLLWFDQHLKGAAALPRTPAAQLSLNTRSGIPLFEVTPDPAAPGAEVAVYYTLQGDQPGTQTRYWRVAAVRRDGPRWTAQLPVWSTNQPLWVYADLRYPLATPVVGAGYYYTTYTARCVSVSSRLLMAQPAELAAANARPTLKPSLLLEDFSKGWEKGWYNFNENGQERWPCSTTRPHDPQFAAPPWAKLGFEVRSAQTNTLAVGLDEFAVEVPLRGGRRWQRVELFPTDFHNAAGTSILDWTRAVELRLGPGTDWQGVIPEFRNLRWIEGTREELNARRTVRLAQAET